MSVHLMLAFTNAVAGREAAFDAWYADVHAPQVLTVPGFRAFQRFTFTYFPAVARSHYRYLCVYEIETGDLARTLAELGRRARDFTRSDAIEPRQMVLLYTPVTGAYRPLDL